ncbi:MAG TPA: hypothetical protein ENJ60_10580 [Aeromonadales bacterium]|nr:hypothetical protein [Aeromonadales bacterium]
MEPFRQHPCYLNEHIPRKSNAVDQCNGIFWEGHFKSHPLLDERTILASITIIVFVKFGSADYIRRN